MSGLFVFLERQLLEFTKDGFLIFEQKSLSCHNELKPERFEKNTNLDKRHRNIIPNLDIFGTASNARIKLSFYFLNLIEIFSWRWHG